MNRAVFLDRDGVINKNRADYVKSWDEFEFIPNAIEALKTISEAGYKIIIVTNQSGIAKGYYTEAMLIAIHKRMEEELSKHDVRMDAIKYCPHNKDSGCRCRKPEPFMVLSAADELDVDLNKSWLIGDKLVDIKTAENIRKIGYEIRSILVKTGYGGSDSPNGSEPDYIASDLAEAVDIILNA